MENNITADKAGTISEIKVTPGQSVGSGTSSSSSSDGRPRGQGAGQVDEGGVEQVQRRGRRGRRAPRPSPGCVGEGVERRARRPHGGWPAASAASARLRTTWLECGGVSSRPKQPHEPIIVPRAQRGDHEGAERAGSWPPPPTRAPRPRRRWRRHRGPARPPSPSRTSHGDDGRRSARRAPTVMVGSSSFCAPARASSAAATSGGTGEGRQATRPPRPGPRTATGARGGCRRCRRPGARW